MYALCRTGMILLTLITSHIVNHFSLTLNSSVKNLMKIFSLESQVTSECTVVSAANMRSNWCLYPIACGPDNRSRTAQDVLAAAQQTMQDNGTNSIICVGHSLGMSFKMLMIRSNVSSYFLGAALSVLDAIFFQIHISGANIEIINYGSPRVKPCPFLKKQVWPS